jgi:hypothetical protein
MLALEALPSSKQQRPKSSRIERTNNKVISSTLPTKKTRQKPNTIKLKNFKITKKSPYSPLLIDQISSFNSSFKLLPP